MCKHIHDDKIYKANLKGFTIYKDECVYCFEGSNSEAGLNLCLTCYIGTCANYLDRNIFDHTDIHKQKTSHVVYLNIKQTKEKVDAPKTDINKIAINKEGGGIIDVEVVTHSYRLICTDCQIVEEDVPEQYNTLIKAIEDHHSAYKQAQLEAWELELKMCPHSRNITQTPQNSAYQVDLDKCSDCDLKSNLWLCLTCGNIGCGRKNYDGSGGNNHGINHYKSSMHPISIKVGTLGGESIPSAYCYICDDDVNVPDIAKTLLIFGIEINKMSKTEKTINEMSLEYNLNFELSKNFERDEQLVKLDDSLKPNGLINIGNSCYMNAVMINLFSILELYKAFSINNPKVQEYIYQYTGNAATSLEIQSSKLADVISDKAFYDPRLEVRPYMFRHLVGKDHPEFRTQKQQDASEYLIHVLQYLQRAEKNLDTSSGTNLFDFESSNVLTCNKCGCYYVRDNVTNIFNLKFNQSIVDNIINSYDDKKQEDYQVNLLQVIKDGVEADDEVLSCKNCNTKQIFNSKMFIRKFPKYLIVKVQNFSLVNFQAVKLHFNMNFDHDKLDMDYLDVANVEKTGGNKMALSSDLEFNPEYLDTLKNMGFSEQRSKRALAETSNNLENAINLLFTKEGDPEFDKPLNTHSPADNQFFNEVYSIVGDMGVPPQYVKKVCKHFHDKGGDFVISYIFDNPADNGSLMDVEEPKVAEKTIIDNGSLKYKAIGGVVHLGKSTHVGHYVAFARKPIAGKSQWVYYNDDKVYIAENPKLGKSYLLFLEQI